MVRKTKEEAQETRARILSTSLRLFYELGYQDTTINDIAIAMGATRGAIYWHFKSKGDILRALWNERSVFITDYIDNLSIEDQDPRIALRALLEHLLGKFTQNNESRMFFHVIHIMLISGKDQDVLFIREQARKIDDLLFERFNQIIKRAYDLNLGHDHFTINEISSYLHIFLDGHFMNRNNLTGFNYELFKELQTQKVIDFIMNFVFKS